MEILAFLGEIPRMLPSIGVIILYVVVLWLVFDRLTAFNDREELFHKQNVAYLLQRLGLISAQVIAMLAVVPDFDPAHPWESAAWLLFEGLWVAVALIAARWVVDWIILAKTKNQALLLQGNLAVGVAEFGAYIGIGLLLGGSLTGTADTLWLSVLSTVVFYLLGLGFVAGVFWLYELITPYHLRNRLKEGDLPAGIELAAVFVAACTAVKVGVAGDFESWGSGIAWFFVTAVVSVLLLGIIWWLSLMLSYLLWRVPKAERSHQSPTLTTSMLRGGVMVLASIVVSAAISAT